MSNDIILPPGNPFITRKEARKRMRVGDIMKRQRQLLNLTQKQVAKDIGICTEHYRDLELNRKCPGLDTALALVFRLNFSLDNLIIGGPE